MFRNFDFIIVSKKQKIMGNLQVFSVLLVGWLSEINLVHLNVILMSFDCLFCIKLGVMKGGSLIENG